MLLKRGEIFSYIFIVTQKAPPPPSECHLGLTFPRTRVTPNVHIFKILNKRYKDMYRYIVMKAVHRTTSFNMTSVFLK
jgi:hypothetical protein